MPRPTCRRPFRSLSLAGLAACVGGAAVASAPAEAAKTPPDPLQLQVFKCKAGKLAFKDTTPAAERVPLGRFEPRPESTLGQLQFTTRYRKVAASGVGREFGFDLILLEVPDPRTATFPVVVPSEATDSQAIGSCVDTVTRDVLKGPDVQLESTTTRWSIDPSQTTAFRVDLKRYDAATGRLFGKFRGTLAPAGDSPEGTKPLKMTGGTFAAVLEFLDLEPPPTAK